jgi:toxin-antitoxin system PIN domain toxin
MPTSSATADLLDVNVWLAFSVEGHPQHKAAIREWSELNRPSFCRLTVLALMRLLCNKDVMGPATFQPEDAWAQYEHLRVLGAIEYAEEPDGLETNLKVLTKGAKATRDFWTDAYLAAFAQTAQMRLVTFDSGFSRLKDLNCLLLSPRA